MRKPIAGAESDAGFRWDMPAPIDGWNVRDDYSSMKASYAIQLDNFFPGTTSVDLRPGSVTYAALPAGKNIRSLMGVSKADGTFYRFAAAEDGIYDITTNLAPGAPASAATVNQWEHTQINVAGISYLWACAGDGVNKARIFNATSGAWTVLDAASTPAITGITSENIAHIALFKYRLIACVKGELAFYYGPLGSVGGAFSKFDLGQIFKKGGYLMATENWTLDAGDGSDDYFVAVTSEGEVAVYKGTDPSIATSFALVGVYNLGRPVGRRCFMQFAGDVALLAETGLWPLSRSLLQSSLDRRVALTDNIIWAFNSYFKQFGTNFGWQSVVVPKGPALAVNVPIGSSRSYQFVMNTITGAWTRFYGWNAECMMVLAGRLFFAIGNKVKEGWTGTADDLAAITGFAQTAYSYGPTRSRVKKINLVKPLLQTASQVSLGLALDTDFELRRGITNQASVAQNLAIFASAIYGQATWAGGQTTNNKWKSVKHRPGAAFSLRLQLQVKNFTVSWTSTAFIGEAGGLL